MSGVVYKTETLLAMFTLVDMQMYCPKHKRSDYLLALTNPTFLFPHSNSHKPASFSSRGLLNPQ